jgi:TonB family protein
MSRFLILLGAVLLASPSSAQGLSGRGLTIHSQVQIRAYATAAPLPQYPRRLALAKMTGLVVVEVSVGPGGVVRSLKVIDSFDNEASASVVSTVQRWRFEPFETSMRSDVAAGKITLQGLRDVLQLGKLIFEFKMDGSVPVVVDLGAAMVARQREIQRGNK